MSVITETVKLRAQATAQIRQFFAEHGVVEVMTPSLTEFGVTDPHVRSIELSESNVGDSRSGRLFLRTSPEYFHKRLLSAGVGDLFELGPVYRADEHGRYHRTEFLMLEWYRMNWSWRQLADEVLEMIQLLSDNRVWKVHYRSWHSISQAQLGLDASQTDAEELRLALNGIQVEVPDQLEQSELLDWWFATRVQPQFDPDTLTVVYDYPAAQAALARLKPGQAQWAERFEIFAGSLELANGYRELTDPTEQQARFESDHARRKALGLPGMPTDPDFIQAIEQGLPECAGVALGFERLLMALNSLDTIDEIALSQ